jgi:myo-inositol-1(or 4)-monophosphatase
MGAGSGAMHLDDLRDVAVEAVHAAGAVLREGLGSPKRVAAKSGRTSIVTWVDTAAQDEIVRVIRAHHPHDAILGEEGAVEAATTDAVRVGAGERPRTWIVDPLDGTSNYAHGIPFACTSVAVRDVEGLAAGAILDPFRGELFTAQRGGGAWLGGERLSVSETPALDRALVCTGVQSDDAAAVASFARRVEQLVTRCRAVRWLGSPALCLAYVAAGRVDAFLERDGTYAWDIAAGGLMVTEAGGRLEDLDGGPPNLGPGLANVIASNDRIFDALAGVVRRDERERGRR